MLIMLIINVDFCTEYPDCFGEIGLSKNQDKIQHKSDAELVIYAPRRVSIALKDKLRNELNRMKRLDIIEEVPISESSELVNSMVIVEKQNGKLRSFLDPSDLSKATKHNHHHLPTTDEILSKLSNGKVFTKVDFKSIAGHWQIPIDADSSRLLTFNTPFVRHCLKRMPYGLHSASGVF